VIRRPLWLDGKIVPAAEATMPVMAHAAHRGSLVFDFGTFHETPRGVAVFRQREHLARFRRSTTLVGLELAFDEHVLVEATGQAIRASGLTEGYVRWSALVVTSEADLVPASPRARVAIAAYVAGDLRAEGEPPPPKARPLRIAVFGDARKAPPEALSPLVKVGGAYTGPMIAKRRAVAAGADEVVLLDGEGNVAEAPTSNVFAVIDGALVTPPLGRILDGITRDSVLAIARAEGIPAREEVLSVAALVGADEAFLTASSFPIAPIASVNGVALKRAAPGEVTARLSRILVAAERGADGRFVHWTE
jgi:branched-chain amino acid aminotransferase